MDRIEPGVFAKLVDMAMEEPGRKAMRQVIEKERMHFDILFAPASKSAIHVAVSRVEPGINSKGYEFGVIDFINWGSKRVQENLGHRVPNLQMVRG
ncbi:hypothetical protein AAG584_21255 [Vreelandella titanicae]|uniref:hypothetical protein n=1 Tax=Vreelandella titanicae TaxID=664683 RepID=UPI0003450C57|nr:hypothetical protein [Halomonas titanicae]MBR9902448.1 hypothetical protein [Gammaproteobacteria bacterium]QNU63191.1 hypothetical protein HZS52_02110 [Halomonas titanicae]